MSSFSFFHWAVFLVVLFVLYVALASVFRLIVPRKGPERICLDCGTQGRAKVKTPGSIWIEVILWLALIVPGLIYSVWRLSSKKLVCPACGSTRLVPTDSPAGLEAVRRYQSNP